MSFCSPYWIESYDESFSSFKNMGLWEYCFKDFYYPYYQFPRKFNGCHNIFSHVSWNDRAKKSIRADQYWLNCLIFRNTTWSVNTWCPAGFWPFRPASLSASYWPSSPWAFWHWNWFVGHWKSFCSTNTWWPESLLFAIWQQVSCNSNTTKLNIWRAPTFPMCIFQVALFSSAFAFLALMLTAATGWCIRNST